MNDLNIGSDVTINGKVISMIRWKHDDSPAEITVCLNSGKIIVIAPQDVNTYHPYEEPPKEDKRKGK